MSIIEMIRSKAHSNRKTIVLPEGDEIRTLKAATIIREEGLAESILLGNRLSIDNLAAATVWI